MEENEELSYCPGCGQKLPVFESVSIKFCPYCGVKLYDSELLPRTSENKSNEEQYSYQYSAYVRTDIDHARIVESNNSLKKVVIEKFAEAGQLFFKAVGLCLLFLAVIAGGWFLCSCWSAHSPVSVPAKAETYLDQPVKSVKQELQDAGFTNIKLNPVDNNVLYDVNMPFTEWRLYSVTVEQGNVLKTSIAGKTDFKKGDSFSRDAKIVITYFQK